MTEILIFYDKLIDVFLDKNESKNFKYIIYIIQNKLYNDNQKDRIINYIKDYVTYEEIIKNNRIDRYNRSKIFFEFLLDNNIIQLPTLDNYKDHIICKLFNNKNKIDYLMIILISRLLREDEHELLEKILLNNKHYHMPTILQSLIINLDKNIINNTIIHHLTRIILNIYHNSITIKNLDVFLDKLDLIKSYLKDKYVNLNLNIKKEDILTEDKKYINYNYLVYMIFNMINKNLDLRIDTYNINQKRNINKKCNENIVSLREYNYNYSYSLI